MAQSAFKKVLPVLIGNGFEAYDFVLYGMLAPTFSVIFFPDDLDKNIALTFAFLLFFCAYLTRPIGGIIWGYIGDIYGRKVVLTSTVTIMAIAAIGMVVIPTYNQIGLLAPTILLILRIMQGIAFAGEFPTAMVALYELSPNSKKGFFCSLAETVGTSGHLIGIIICILVLFSLDQNHFNSFGWRIPFVLSFLFIFIVFYIRSNFTETLTKQISLDNKSKIPVLNNFKLNFKCMLRIFLFISTNSFLLFSFLFYTNCMLDKHYAESVRSAFFPWIVQLFCVLFLVILYPILGYLSDKIGVFRMSNFGHIIILCFYFPTYNCLVLSYNFTLNLIGIALIAFYLSMLATSYIPIIIKMANDKCRVSIITFSWGISVIIFGASAPVVSQFLIDLSSYHSIPAIYLTTLCLISLLISYSYTKKAGEKHV